MNCRTRIATFVLVACVGTGLTPRHATAQTDAKLESGAAEEHDDVLAARKLVDEAMGHYAKADWDGARELLLKALAVRSHRAILGTLVDVEIKANRYLDAANHLQQLLADLPPEPRKRVEAAEAQLLECRPQLGTLNVTVNVAGATVLVNGSVIGTSPLTREVFVEPGGVAVAVEHPDYRRAERELWISKGQKLDVALDMQPRVAKAEATPKLAFSQSPSPDHASPKVSARTIVAISGGVLAVAAATTGTVFWLKSKNTDSDARALSAELIAGNPSAPSYSACHESYVIDQAGCAKLAVLARRWDREHNFAVVSLVGAGVTAAATAITYFLWPSKAHVTPTDHPSQARVVLEPWSSPTGHGLQLLGSF